MPGAGQQGRCNRLEVAWQVGWLSVQTWPVPSAPPRSQLVPSQEKMVPSLHWMGTGRRRLIARFPNRRLFPSLRGPPFKVGPLVQPSPGSLHRWGQHRAPAPAPPTVHHAPGGAGGGRCGRGHQLRLWSPPQLLQLLRQLHERSGALQPHEPRQQRPVSSGRRPRSSAQGPMARCPPAQPSRALADTSGLSLGRKFVLRHLGFVFSSCRPG